MFRQQGNLLHFEDMLHNSVYFIQNAVYFIILSLLLKQYVFHKPCAKV